MADSEPRLSDLARKILAQRGVSSSPEVRAFLDPAFYTPTPPLQLPGLERAVQLLLEGIAGREKICVYGDYDADGVTSTALLVTLLSSLGADVCYHVPDRFREGYGMSEGVVRELAAKGVTLILTCDCGISNRAEIALAKELGLMVLVTDHHLLPPDLPDADCIVNPQQLPEGHPSRTLSGVGVAYMLARGVLEYVGRGEESKAFLDLVAIGTVADVVPLRAENRFLLQSGLKVLQVSRRAGIRALCRESKLIQAELTEEEIGFQLAPRINAAGRVSSAVLGVELLLAKDEQKASELAVKLETINQQRRKIGEEIFQQAQGMLNLDYGLRPIVLYSPDWHHGVIGIVAGRLAELHQVPVLLMSLKEDGVSITGSARSIEGVHIYEVIKSCSNYLTKFGGHAGAAGFSLEIGKLELFSKAVEYELEQALERVEPGEVESFDLEIRLDCLSTGTYQELRLLAPFGEGNPAPRFLTRQAEVRSHRAISEDRHLRLVLGHGQTVLQAIWWWGGKQEISPTSDAIYSLSMNRWQGRENLQLIIYSLKQSGEVLKVSEQAPDLELLDLRHRPDMEDRLLEHKAAAFFLEGTKAPGPLLTQSRYTLSAVNTLVLLTPPPGLRVLQEMLALTGATKLILAYQEEEAGGAKEFLERLLGMAKYAISNGNGIADIKLLAVRTGQLEITIASGLNYFQAKGILALEYLNLEQVQLQRGNKHAGRTANSSVNVLKSLLAETRAFRRYLLNAPVTNIRLLLLGEEKFYAKTKY